MDNRYRTQPPHLPLYLSPAEIQALVEVDTRGIAHSSPDALLKLQALATCLVTEAANFAATWPGIEDAGLCLTVTPLLPVWEARLFEEDGEQLNLFPLNK